MCVLILQHLVLPVPTITRYSNVAIGLYWRDYLRARGLTQRRLYRADLCISVWFNRNGKADEEITLKVCMAHVINTVEQNHQAKFMHACR